ncbi:MAG TPA: guanylate kinase [Salinivirgaceae bacterium]|nr:guanylate kinase [Salinivirgaceae bacterium]
MQQNEKLIIVSAPSGSGKTTLIKHLMSQLPMFEFSISATTRPMREGETDGKDYYFLTVEKFKKLIEQQQFIEWEEVYEGRYYGTLKSEITRIANKGKIAIFDVDVKGGINIKKLYGSSAFSIFIQPPSIEVLEERLRIRATDTEEDIRARVNKAAEEMTYSSQFDQIVVNDNIEVSKTKLVDIVKEFLGK